MGAGTPPVAPKTGREDFSKRLVPLCAKTELTTAKSQIKISTMTRIINQQFPRGKKRNINIARPAKRQGQWPHGNARSHAITMRHGAARSLAGEKP